MVWLKRIIGIIMVIAGFVGFLYYLPPTVLRFADSTAGMDFMNFVTSKFSFLSQSYENIAGAMLFGLSLPLAMMIICLVVFILGLFLI
jgi:hypothetical protein